MSVDAVAEMMSPLEREIAGLKQALPFEFAHRFPKGVPSATANHIGDTCERCGLRIRRIRLNGQTGLEMGYPDGVFGAVLLIEADPEFYPCIEKVKP